MSILLALLAASPARGQISISGDVSPSPAVNPIWDVGQNINIGNTGTGSMTISTGGTVNSSGEDFSSIGNGVGSVGTVTVDGGTWNEGIGLSVGPQGNGTLSLTAGTVSVLGEVEIAGAGWTPNPGTGSVTVSGGTWTSSGNIKVGFNGNGSFHLSGGSVTTGGGVVIYSGVNGAGSVAVSGGNWTISGNINVAGTFELSNGTVSSSALISGGGSSANLTGGTFTTGQVASGSGNNGAVTFNGGTLRLSGNQTNLFSGIEAGDVTLVGSGGTIDTQAFNVSTAYALSGNGSLTKTGTGTLTLSGANTYTGDTFVDAGTFLVDGSLDLGTVNIASGATLGGDGTMGGSLHFDAGASLLFNPSHTLTINGATVTFGGFSVADLVGLDSSAALGTYTLLGGSATFDFTNVANFGAGNAYDLGGGKSAYFQAGSLQLVVVPEPSLTALLVFGGLALLVSSRFRRLRKSTLQS